MATKTNKTKPTPFKPKSPAPVAPKPMAAYQPSQQEIAARAFEIFSREGGGDFENWLRAERELRARGPA